MASFNRPAVVSYGAQSLIAHHPYISSESWASLGTWKGLGAGNTGGKIVNEIASSENSENNRTSSAALAIILRFVENSLLLSFKHKINTNQTNLFFKKSSTIFAFQQKKSPEKSENSKTPPFALRPPLPAPLFEAKQLRMCLLSKRKLGYKDKSQKSKKNCSVSTGKRWPPAAISPALVSWSRTGLLRPSCWCCLGPVLRAGGLLVSSKTRAGKDG